MLTIDEQMKLKEILKFIRDEKSVSKTFNHKTANIDVTSRLRDEKGRFLPNHRYSQKSLNRVESQLELGESDKPIKLVKVKVKGSYGTYEIRKKWFTDEEMAVLCVFAAITVLVILL